MKKVLIVDDFIEYRYEYKAMLENTYKIELAGNLEEAKDKINKSISLAVIDINLDRFDRKNKDGISLAHWIKENYPDIKIILVTAFFKKNEIEDIYDSFIQKPIIEDVLVKKAKNLIGI